MNVSEILETIDSYARDYIRYLLSIANRATFKEKAGEFEPKLINFSLISVFIASFLFDRFVRHSDVSQGVFVDDAVRDFSTWLFIALALYCGLNLGSGTRVKFNHALSIVLRVLPVAFVMAAYVATLAAQGAQLITQWLLDRGGCAPWYGYVMLTLVQCGVVLMFLPISIARYVDHDHPAPDDGAAADEWSAVRIRVLTAMVVAIILAVRLAAVASTFSDNVRSTYIAATKACAANKACLARQQDRRQILLGEILGLEACF